MKLMVELRLEIVSIDSDGVTIQPEYWHENKCIVSHPSRKCRPGESVICGPHMFEVEFCPPVVG